MTYTTPVDPNAATERPGPSTTTTTTARPPPPIVNPNKMDFAALQQVQADVATLFQKGELSTALNVTVADMAMEVK